MYTTSCVCVHIVPDFGELLLRCGLGATPAVLGGPSLSLGRMRYHLNAFFPCRGAHPCPRSYM